jgi:hypothetical protein
MMQEGRDYGGICIAGEVRRLTAGTGVLGTAEDFGADVWVLGGLLAWGPDPESPPMNPRA